MSRSRTSSSSSSRVSFAPVRLNDLKNKYDDYGLNNSDLIDEEAIEATVSFTESPKREQSQESSSSFHMPDEHVIPAGGEESDSASIDKASLGSNDSKDRSVIGEFIDKSKNKVKKLVSKKEKSKSPSDTIEETRVEDTFIMQPNHVPMRLSMSEVVSSSAEIPASVEQPPSLIGPGFGYSLAQRYRTMPFFRQRVAIIVILLSITFIFPGFLIGVLWGFYVSFIGFLYLFVSDPKPKEALLSEESFLIADQVDIASEAEVSFDGKGLGVGDGITYKGWMNELKIRYSPANFHVNNAHSVLIRLEGTTLRISRPAKTVLKHAFHEDPTLKNSQPSMISQTIYDLSDAKVSLRPKRLAARRWWSRKYPIHIRFANKTSALAEIDMTNKAMTRSASLHPVGSGPDGLPILSEIPKVSAEDPGYSAESESSDDEKSSLTELHRSSSANDLSEFHSKSDGLSSKTKGRSIYLFARAAREKERWFHLLREACSKSKMLSGGAKIMKRSSSCDPTKIPQLPKEAEEPRRCSHPAEAAMEYIHYQKNHVQFAKQMYDVLARAVVTPERDSIVSVDLGTMKWQPGVREENSDLVESINSLATRIFFDFCRDQFWLDAVKQKIQSKIATIHLPYFIETLDVSELDLGITAPRISSSYSPKFDEWGLWVDFDFSYQGLIRLVIQTSVNLLKLKSGSHSVETEKEVSRFTNSVRATRYSDDEVPESPESSPDEDFGSKNEHEQVKERRSKKILTFVEKAAQSALFQKASKIASVAKLMQEFSSTPLILNVEISSLEGTMTVNIPPPPSDRLWYAFRRVPKMSVKAVPQVGDRSVDFTTVSDWIESKIKLLITKNLVCPNMDDIILPVMTGNALLQMGYNR